MRRDQMVRNTKVQMLVVLVAGAVMGYAASGKLNSFQRAEAAPPQGASTAEKTGGTQPGDPSCW
jgi:hypothetical protein